MIALLPIAYSTGTSDTKVWFKTGIIERNSMLTTIINNKNYILFNILMMLKKRIIRFYCVGVTISPAYFDQNNNGNDNPKEKRWILNLFTPAGI